MSTELWCPQKSNTAQRSEPWAEGRLMALVDRQFPPLKGVEQSWGAGWVVSGAPLSVPSQSSELAAQREPVHSTKASSQLSWSHTHRGHHFQWNKFSEILLLFEIERSQTKTLHKSLGQLPFLKMDQIAIPVCRIVWRVVAGLAGWLESLYKRASHVTTGLALPASHNTNTN